MNIQVSIVIPVYNVEKYIAHCIDSILDQKGVKFEIICIEDGSTDRSKQILEEYASKDNRIHIIYHNKNRGPSASRNDGIVSAQGKYIWFVDADDSIMQESLKKIYDCANLNKLDMLTFGMSCDFENSKLEQQYRASKVEYRYKYEEIYTGQKMMATILKNSEFFYGCVCRFLFRKDFLIKEKLYFIDGLIFEDNLYVPQCYLKANRVKCINESFYHRYRREGSITTSKSEVIKAKSLFVCYEELWKTTLASKLDEDGEFGIGEILTNFGITIKLIAEKESLKYEGNNPLEKHLWDMICGDMKRQVIEEKVKFLIAKKEERKLYIYGAGKYAEEVFCEINRLDIPVEGVIVTKKEEDKKSTWGHLIKELNEVKDQLTDAMVIVAVAGDVGRIIERMLKREGINFAFSIE